MTPWAHLLRGAALRPGYAAPSSFANADFGELVPAAITARLETLPGVIHTKGPGLYGGYHPLFDTVLAPSCAYRGGVLAHELIHWTAPRVGRSMQRRTAWQKLREEWTAELGTVKLLGALGHPCDVRKARRRLRLQRAYLYHDDPFGWGLIVERRRTAHRCPTNPGQEWLAADDDSTTAVEYILDRLSAVEYILDRLASAARVSTIAPPPAAPTLPSPWSDAA